MNRIFVCGHMTKKSISFVELMAELGISDVSEVSDPPFKRG